MKTFSLSVIRYLLCFIFLSFLHITEIFSQDYSARQLPGQVSGGYETKYLVYTPFDYPAPATEYPLLICLHGGSAIGDDLTQLTNTSHQTPTMLISNDRWYNLPFIVVSPQLKRDLTYFEQNDQNWPPEQIDELIDHIVNTYNVDENRIYLTGISLGGAGTWAYAVAHPERLAAILPMGGKTPKGDACLIKDLPIWIFHGQNDALVDTWWSTDMVAAIEACQPSGIYTPHLNLSSSMGHEVWNQVFNLRGGYDIYAWLLSFVRGDHSNKAPFVFTGADRKIAMRTGPIYLTCEYFDSDGTITNVQWTQIPNGNPTLALAATSTRFMEITTPQVGTYIFRLTVTDNDGASRFDEVQVQILASNEVRAVTALKVFRQEALVATEVGTLADNQVYNIDAIAGTNSRINIRADVNGVPSNGRVRWSINSDQDTRDAGGTAPVYVKSPTSNVNTTGWGITPGTYLVCATPYLNPEFDGEGTSLCHKITFTNEPIGLTKFYAKPNEDLSSLLSWGTSTDGSGSSPASFGAANQWFILAGTANVTAAPLNIGTNRLVVQTEGDLTIANTFTGSLYVEGNGTVTVNSGNLITAASLSTISRTSTFEYNGGAMPIPKGDYGNLNIRGAGNKTLPTGITEVRGNLTVDTGAILMNPVSGGDHGVRVAGNATIRTASTQPYVMRFSGGYGNQYFYLPGNHQFRDFYIDGGCTVNVQAPATTTITLGVGTSGGKAEFHDYALLKLNGHNLTLTANAAINPDGNGGARTGQIEVDNSTITINTTSTGANSTPLNLYPAPGKNNLKSLNATLPAANAGLNIMAPLTITQNVRVSTGTINANGNLTLLSTPTSTAYVSRVENNGEINGTVNVQRSIPTGRLYRYLGFPVAGATVANLITHLPVTGNFSGASPGTINPSLFYYNEVAGGWVNYPATGGTALGSPLHIGQGYSAFVRETTNPEHITLSGTLHIGDFNYGTANLLASNPTSGPNLGWALLGNPYACPIKWAEPTGWDRSGISNTVYVRANGDGGERIRYFDGSVGNLVNGVIASGQSFWVRSTGATPLTLVVKEAAKIEMTNIDFFRTGSGDINALHVNLRRNNLEDDTYIKFNSAGSPKFHPELDAVKMKNSFFNVSILSSDSVGTAIKNLCDTLCSQEVVLAVETNEPGNYTLSAEGTAFDHLSELFIVDTYTHATTKLEEGDDFTFVVTSDANSSNPKRFRLLIDKNHSPRPVITYHNGALISSVTENVQWMLNGEIIPGATTAQWVPDADGDYSVQATHKGCSKTSMAYSFRITEAENPVGSEIKVYPNPAINVLHVTGLTAENEYTITSLSGAAVESGLVGPADNGEGTIRLKSVSPGFYFLRLKHVGGEHQFKFSVR